MKNTLILINLISLSLTACSSNVEVVKENHIETDTIVKVQPKNSVKQLAQLDLDSVLKRDSVILIDVRTPEEISQGYIPGADSFINYYAADFNSKINLLNKKYTYVMYCRSGGRSANASAYMVKQGFTQVYNLTGGVLGYKGTLEKP